MSRPSTPPAPQSPDRPDPGDQRYYDVAEANAHVRQLSQLFELVLELRMRIKQLVPPEEGKRRLAPPGVERSREPEEDRHLVRALVETLNETTDQIAALGCVIKDVEIGLVDWPAWHDGRPIWLCWRFGEHEVGFWHDTDTGYAGRRPVAELGVGEDPTR